MKKVLFVCTGNTCRSFMAELLLNKISKDRGLGLEARSCGVAAERTFQVPAGVWSAMKPKGIDPADHVAQLVSRDLLKWADLVLTMTRGHREELLDSFPESTPKVHLLRAYAGLGEEDVADPIGQPDAVYAECRDRIVESLEALVRKVSGTKGSAGGSPGP